jgi:hypothetical protein
MSCPICKDFGMDRFPSAEEMRARTSSNSAREELRLIQQALDRIREDDGNRARRLNWELSDQSLYDAVVEFLEDRGYQVNWNGACLWLEIDW